MEKVNSFDNYFDLLQVPQQLPVEQSVLNQHYQQLQKQYHPDNFALADEAQKAQMMLKSATINSAYKVLKDTVKSAEHLLLLNGFDADSEQKTITDNEFLMQQFMLREQLDEIEQTNDWSGLEQFSHDVMQLKQSLVTQLVDDVNHKNWQSAQERIYHLRYINRLIEHVELIEENQN